SLDWAFQPQYGVREQAFIGAEVLVRWRHPRMGWLPPDRFIPLAEDYGLIRTLTVQALREGINMLEYLNSQGRNCHISINVSANDLADPATVESLLAMLGEHGPQLTLEITETALM